MRGVSAQVNPGLPLTCDLTKKTGFIACAETIVVPTDSKASVRWYGPGPSTPQMLASVDDNGVVTIDWSVCEEVAKLELGLATEVRLWETIAVARMLLAVRDGTYKAKE